MDLDPEGTKRKREEEPPNKLTGINKSKHGVRDKKRKKSSDGETQVLHGRPGTETTPTTIEDAPAAKSNLDLAAIEEILADLRGKVENLEVKVRSLTIENTNLRGKAEAILRFSQITEEDEAAFRTADDFILKSIQGSPTPVAPEKDKTAEKTSWEIKKGTNKTDRTNFPQDPREDHRGRERHSEIRVNDQSTKNRRNNDQDTRNRRNKSDSRSSKNNEGNRVDIDDQEEVPRLDQETGRRDDRHKDEIRRGHRKYLEECFRQQIGLPIDNWRNINIYSFTDHRVAKGYQKVVITCQGMYYEIKENQVDWESMGRKRLTIGGDFCWRGNGVTIYQPTRERTRRPIVPHRFAINLGQQYQQTW